MNDAVTCLVVTDLIAQVYFKLLYVLTGAMTQETPMTTIYFCLN